MRGLTTLERRNTNTAARELDEREASVCLMSSWSRICASNNLRAVMVPRPRNYYQLLGVPPDASAQEIQSAYRRLARLYHPDLNEGGDAGARFNEVSDAYEVLHDPAQRTRYDRSGAVGDAAITIDHASATGEKTSAARQAPFFSSPRPRHDVPRFLDDQPGAMKAPGGVDARFGRGRGLRVQLVVRWLR